MIQAEEGTKDCGIAPTRSFQQILLGLMAVKFHIFWNVSKCQTFIITLFFYL